MTANDLPSQLDIARVRDARSGRVSSWYPRGRNQDAWIVGPGETRVLADLEGPGAVTHMWLTQYCRRIVGPGFIDPLDTGGAAPVLEIHNALGLNREQADPDYYRKVLLRVTYDDATEPSILVPLGDFFGVGHSMPNSYASAFITVTAKPEESLIFGGSASLNSYLAMPFAERVLIEVVNENDVAYGQYFHVDHELCRQPLPDDIAYLHAAWRRVNPNPGWGPDLQTNSPETNVPNLTDAKLPRAGGRRAGPLRGLQPLGLPWPGQLVGRGPLEKWSRHSNLDRGPAVHETRGPTLPTPI